MVEDSCSKSVPFHTEDFSLRVYGNDEDRSILFNRFNRLVEGTKEPYLFTSLKTFFQTRSINKLVILRRS